MTTILLVVALLTGTQAQERNKDRGGQGAREVKREVVKDTEKAAEKTERAVLKAADKAEKGTLKAGEKAEGATLKAVDKLEKAGEKAEDATLRAADKLEKAGEKAERGINRAVSGNGPKTPAQDNNGRGNAYGKDKEGMQGREFGQNRAQQARNREQLNTTVDEHDIKLKESRDKIKDANERLESERTAGKVTAEEYQARKERIAKAEQGVKELERKVEEGKRLK